MEDFIPETVIESAKNQDYPQLLEVWEASVRATHDFLAEDDLQTLKPLILNQYFDAVVLHCAKNKQGEILGFSGVLNGSLEMLFVTPNAHRQGIGTLLVSHAINRQGVTKVDVNEQNPQAVGFYKKIGFSVIGRSPIDGQGNNYPLLHMSL